MAKLTVREYVRGDSRKFTPKPGIYDEHTHDNIERIFDSGPKMCWLFTMFIGDDPIAVIGGTLIDRGGCVELFSILSDRIFEQPLAFARTVERCMTYCQKKFKFHRYQTLIKTDEIYLHRWAVFLKMEPEGVLRKLYNKQDHTIYSRIY